MNQAQQMKATRLLLQAELKEQEDRMASTIESITSGLNTLVYDFHELKIARAATLFRDLADQHADYMKKRAKLAEIKDI